jgi:predicted TIM-barrel fold metal-dependent hydrolase
MRHSNCGHEHHAMAGFARGCAPGSRRHFLGSVAATLGAAGALGILGTWAQGAADPRRRLIDVHHHIVPSFFFEAVKDRISGAAGWFGWTSQKALDEMDRHGVATALVSYTTPGAWLGDVERSRDLARKCNEYSARLAKDHPGRFGFFAALPLPDPEGSLREIEYALDVLKAEGIGLMTSYEDKWLGDPAFTTVFDELNRRKAVVYVHPTAPACCRRLMSYVPPNMTEFVQDTNRAITSLMFSGTLSRLRDIRFIFSHAGGTMPMLAGRISENIRRGQLSAKVPHGVEFELRRLFYEVANSATRPAMAALTSLIPIAQVMFGSDFPFVSIAVTADGLENVGISKDDVRAIARENALALFPHLKR